MMCVLLSRQLRVLRQILGLRSMLLLSFWHAGKEFFGMEDMNVTGWGQELRLEFFERDSPDDRPFCNVWINRNFYENFFHKWKSRKKYRQLAETELQWYELLFFLAEIKRKEELCNRRSLWQTPLLLVFNIQMIDLALFQDMEPLYLPLIFVWGFGILVCSRVLYTRSWQQL